MIGRSILLATAMAAALAWLGPALDGIDDHSDERAQADNLEQAYRDAERLARWERAVTELCGPQAAWKEIGEGVIQCFTRRGRPTLRATVHKE